MKTKKAERTRGIAIISSCCTGFTGIGIMLLLTSSSRSDFSTLESKLLFVLIICFIIVLAGTIIYTIEAITESVVERLSERNIKIESDITSKHESAG